MQGDQCLREVAQILAGVLQRPADLVARYGGEEFAAILPATDHDGAMRMAEVMREAIAACALPHRDSTVAPHVTVIIGVSTRKPDGTDDERLLIEATDLGLHEAKRTGRTRVGSIDTAHASLDRTGAAHAGKLHRS